MNVHPQPSSCFWIQSLVKCLISWRGTPLKEKRVDLENRLDEQTIRNLSLQAKPFNFIQQIWHEKEILFRQLQELPLSKVSSAPGRRKSLQVSRSRTTRRRAAAPFSLLWHIIVCYYGFKGFPLTQKRRKRHHQHLIILSCLSVFGCSSLSYIDARLNTYFLQEGRL